MAKYQKGQSGNPAGKPKGALSPSGRLRDAIGKDLPKILAVLREKALDGDVQAAALLLSRALPALRPESSSQVIPGAGNSISERAEAVIASALSGETSPSVTGELMAALVQQGRIFEISDFDRRLAALEEKNHGAK